jgi:WD40 repeat protein
VATVSADRSVRLWDAATGKAQALLQEHDRPVTCLAFSPDGNTLATGSEDKTVILWDIATGKAIRPALAHDSSVIFVGWTPDGRIVSTTYRDSVRLWTRAADEPVIIRKAFTKPIVRYGKQFNDYVALTPDARTLALRDCYWDGRVHLLDISPFIDPVE